MAEENVEVIGWGKIIAIAVAVGLGVGFAFALVREYVWPGIGGAPVGVSVGVVVGLLVARRKKALAAQAAASGGKG